MSGGSCVWSMCDGSRPSSCSLAGTDARVRGAPVRVGGWKAGSGMDGRVCLGCPRPGSGPLTRRRGVGGGRRGMSEGADVVCDDGR